MRIIDHIITHKAKRNNELTACGQFIQQACMQPLLVKTYRRRSRLARIWEASLLPILAGGRRACAATPCPGLPQSSKLFMGSGLTAFCYPKSNPEGIGLVGPRRTSPRLRLGRTRGSRACTFGLSWRPGLRPHFINPHLSPTARKCGDLFAAPLGATPPKKPFRLPSPSPFF